MAIQFPGKVNYMDPSRVEKAVQASEWNALRNQGQRDAQRMKREAFSEEQRIDNTRWLAAATKLGMSMSADQARRAWPKFAEEWGRRGFPLDGLPQIEGISDEDLKQGFKNLHEDALMGLAGYQEKTAVGKTWVNPETGTMWALSRDGRSFDTGVPAQQYAYRPIEGAEGTLPFDPSRGIVGGVVPGTEAGAMAERAATEAGEVQAAKERVITAEVVPRGQAERQVELENAAPSAYRSVDYSIRQMQRMRDQAEQIKNHPGLRNATGFGGETLSGVPGSDAADAAALVNVLKNQSFVAALSAMREASKTGGAVGQVTEAEGARFENLFAALMQAQSYPQFVQQLDQLIRYMDEGMAAIVNSYQNEYGGVATYVPLNAGGPRPYPTGRTATNHETGETVREMSDGSWVQ